MSSSPVVASIPGRMRVRDARLRDLGLLREMLARLEGLPGLFGIESNATTGSVLIHYDCTVTSQPALEQRVRAAFDAVFPSPEPLQKQVRSGGMYRWQKERRWNRAAKWGMLASFPVSLALAAGGSKKLHAVTGGVFSALLLVHLYVHRRHLVK